jgi:hypothetical protein
MVLNTKFGILGAGSAFTLRLLRITFTPRFALMEALNSHLVKM